MSAFLKLLLLYYVPSFMWTAVFLDNEFRNILVCEWQINQSINQSRSNPKRLTGLIYHIQIIFNLSLAFWQGSLSTYFSHRYLLDSRYSNLHHRVWCFLLIIHSQIVSGFHRNSESLRQCVLETNFQVSGDSQTRLQTKNTRNDKIYKSIIK